MTDTASRTVTIGGQSVTIERFQLAKSVRIITMLGVIQKSVPGINSEVAAFRRQYGEENVVELDRVQAKMRFGPSPIFDDDDKPMFHEGELMMMASPVDRLTDEDWEKSGQKLRIRQSPTPPEILAAVFPLVLEQAEKPVLRLLALATMPNEDVARYAGTGEILDRVDEVVQSKIATAYLEEIMELAVVVAELIEGQVLAKARALGARLGNLKRLVGMGTTTPSPSSPETSTTSSAPAAPPSSDSSSTSESSSPGPTPSASSDSPGTSSTPSASTSPASTT